MFAVDHGYAAGFTAFYFLVDGFIKSIVKYGIIVVFLFGYKVSLDQYQSILVLVMLPESFRSVVAAIVRRFPVFTSQLPYMLTASATISFGLLGLIASKTMMASVAFFSILSAGITIMSTLYDGEYISRIKSGDATIGLAGAAYLLPVIGSIFGALSVAVSTKFNILVLVTFAFAMIFNIGIGFGMSTMFIKTTNKRPLLGKKEVAVSNLFEMVVVICSTSIVSALSVINSESSNTAIIVAFLVAVSLVSALVVVYAEQPALLGVYLFVFANEVCYVDITAAMTIFYTQKECGGPAFDLLFYIGWTNIIALVASLCVVVACSNRQRRTDVGVRSAVVAGIMLKIYGSFTDIAIAKRWNVYYGISDRTFYVFGDAMLYPASSVLVFLVLTVAMIPIIKKDAEVSSRAVMLSVAAIGQNVSRMVGLFLGGILGVRDSIGTECDFKGYVSLIVLAHVVFPSVLFPIAYFTLGDVKKTLEYTDQEMNQWDPDLRPEFSIQGSDDEVYDKKDGVNNRDEMHNDDGMSNVYRTSNDGVNGKDDSSKDNVNEPMVKAETTV